MVVARGEGQDIALQTGEQRVEALWRVGRIERHPVGHLVRRGAPQSGAALVGEPLDETIHREVAHGAHRVGV